MTRLGDIEPIICKGDFMYVTSVGAGIAIIMFLLLLFVIASAVFIKRHEKCISSFYWVLREKYPKSYVKQNIIVRLVRKCFRLTTEDTLHWMLALCHFFAVLAVASPLCVPVMLFFVPIKTALAIGIMIMCGLFGVFIFSMEIFTICQMFRCEKIKKKYPEHRTRRLYPWHRNPF